MAPLTVEIFLIDTLYWIFFPRFPRYPRAPSPFYFHVPSFLFLELSFFFLFTAGFFLVIYIFYPGEKAFSRF